MVRFKERLLLSADGPPLARACEDLYARTLPAAPPGHLRGQLLRRHQPSRRGHDGADPPVVRRILRLPAQPIPVTGGGRSADGGTAPAIGHRHSSGDFGHAERHGVRRRPIGLQQLGGWHPRAARRRRQIPQMVDAARERRCALCTSGCRHRALRFYIDGDLMKTLEPGAGYHYRDDDNGTAHVRHPHPAAR